MYTILSFFICSFLGWLCECIYCRIPQKIGCLFPTMKEHGLRKDAQSAFKTINEHMKKKVK